MARPTYDDFSVVEETAKTLVNLLIDKEGRFTENTNIKDEIHAVRKYAEIIAEKIPKLATLVSTRGYKFAVVADDGTVRNATKDEALRLIMGYTQTGGTLLADIRDAQTREYAEFLEWKKTRNS